MGAPVGCATMGLRRIGPVPLAETGAARLAAVRRDLTPGCRAASFTVGADVRTST